MKVTAIFDIGKTNKKFFLFDQDLNEVYRDYIAIKEITDDDNFPCEDLHALESWVFQCVNEVRDKSFELIAINFSTYGASLVHLDETFKPVTPVYNYTKPFSESVLKKFEEKHGPLESWSQETASPELGMLNAGLQLFWLKFKKEYLFSKIKYSLFLPQYFSFLFSGELITEFTSLGCHTGMWNFKKNDYHKWIHEEGFDKLLPPVANKSFNGFYKNSVVVGNGIHDSSAALIPYISTYKEPFLLLSTGTWNICFNPFDKTPLTNHQLKNDCLCYLTVDGSPVKASRLFMGNEYNLWIKKLNEHFETAENVYKDISFDQTLYKKAERFKSPVFHFESIPHHNNEITGKVSLDLNWFDDFEEAFHHLLKELIELQIEKIMLVSALQSIRRIYIDGGFAANDVFINTLRWKLPDFEIFPSLMPLGSAFGAAIVVIDGNKKTIEVCPN